MKSKILNILYYRYLQCYYVKGILVVYTIKYAIKDIAKHVKFLCFLLFIFSIFYAIILIYALHILFVTNHKGKGGN